MKALHLLRQVLFESLIHFSQSKYQLHVPLCTKRVHLKDCYCGQLILSPTYMSICLLFRVLHVQHLYFTFDTLLMPL